MGKKGSSSWLTAVKRAFRSPTKDSDKRSARRREDCDQEEDEEKVLKKNYDFLKFNYDLFSCFVSYLCDPFCFTF
jgi:hypothetical protein